MNESDRTYKDRSKNPITSLVHELLAKLLFDMENMIIPMVIPTASIYSSLEYTVPFRTVPINITGMIFVDLKIVCSAKLTKSNA